MSVHIFGAVVTPYGTAANNRAENEGNITTLQKLIWQGQPHSTVSAEAIRFAVRRLLAEHSPTNRTWSEEERANQWKQEKFDGWSTPNGETFIDDDLLGYMSAAAATEESEASANVRRAVLEITRAVSLTPWCGDVTFNAASPGATPSAAKKGAKNPVPYGTEVHATRYQFGFALTPERLRVRDRLAVAIAAIAGLGPVAGNHGRFLFDFSPEFIVYRITHDPAPRLLYCFDTADNGKTIGASALVSRIECGDINPGELIAGAGTRGDQLSRELKAIGVEVLGVRAAAEKATSRAMELLGA